MVQVRGLESLGITSEQYSSLLIPVILSKFPNEIRLRVARETEERVWEIDKLLKIIKLEVEARESSEGTHVNPTKMTGYQPQNPSGPPATANSLVTNSPSIQCVYCGSEHYSAFCTKFSDVSQQREILTKSGRCFVCLRLNHKSKDYNSQKRCRHCHRSHHQSICDQRPAESPPRAPQDVTPSSQSVTTSTTRKGNGNRVILMQTIQAIASDGGEPVPVRMLLDNGSQLSYVTTSLQSKLNLKPIRREQLHLNTFGMRPS